MTIAQLRALERIESNAAAFAQLIEQTLAVDAELVVDATLLYSQIYMVQYELAQIGKQVRLLQAHVVTDGEGVTP